MRSQKTVWAKRADGHTFRIKVTLPEGYKEGTRLPGLFWFYPAEFADQAAYDRGSPVAPAGRRDIASPPTARAPSPS